MTDNTPARVLLVDDRPANLVALEAVLGDLGVALVRAASGHEALKRLLDADFAAVLLDVQMPGMGGFEVARLMRARERSRHTPVLFVTADTDPGPSVREAYTLGAVDFLVKPVVPEVLRAKVAVFAELYRLREAERRRGEAALRDSEAWLRTVTDSVPVLLAFIDRDLRYRFVNAQYEEWYGVPPAEVSGRELRAVVGEDVFAQRRPFIDQVLAGRPVRFDGPTRHHRLGLRDTEVCYTPHVVAGAVRGFFSVVQDITDRMRAEEALQEASRRKDEFLATLAHELRNPLAPIRNAVAVLRLGPPPGQLGKLVAMMERQLGQVVHMVDDLLDVSRVTSGKIVLRAERLDLREAVDAAVEATRATVEAAGHALEVRLPEEALPVEGDRTRLVQVFTNLLTNAVKYTPAGGRIELSAEPVGGAVVVRVADTGVGIPADMLPKVFEVFTQVDRNIDRAQGGLGLGLALVKKLVEMHGGDVWAESAGPDRGSTFSVRLPLVEST